ncbi:cytochrome b [Alkalisalibacterium limincola]|uniref:Cytochrome b n=1 Tax=Alkalisalibacterium limincola TaxID=2699169 RepID=A0A5C8KP91_9GAMM|nr:cytochrome bc complex cytochrome b subunit [Alkalisalibacterium limincola]TXK62582.1 cytochrome bc complex cytochrome b subunit [Alkalisalibacterium limincola]
MANVISRAVAGATDWFNARTPGLMPAYRKHMSEYYAPKNFNVWYYFGSLAILVLVNQIVTGIWLTMFYKPSAAEAFASVEYIMRDVEWGWLIRYMHSTGASAFFIVVFLHMFRALIYGSYQKPRELVWILGMLILLTLMAEAFLGYVLPWGQMSYHGAQVIVNLFGTVPFIGQELVEFIRGDYLISDATLNRFFALHVIALPLVLLLLVVLHLGALHEVGSNNPEGIDIKKVKDENGKPKDGIPFHPYYTVKDLFGAGFFLTIMAFILFFEPTFGHMFLEYDNFNEANPQVTPPTIVPVWYFTPFYAMLRAIPDAFLGFLVMGGAIIILFFLPWLDKSPVRSIRYRGPLTKVLMAIFVVSFVWLGWLGMQSGSALQTILARVFTMYYFAFFALMPFWTRLDSYKPVPERIPEHD